MTTLFLTLKKGRKTTVLNCPLNRMKLLFVRLVTGINYCNIFQLLFAGHQFLMIFVI